jgi:hypothetical protein
VQQILADLFDLAESLFNYWLDQDKNHWRAGVPTLSANLALILDVQALRLFRSIVQDCRRAEAFTASILTRTLFETVLAVLFLLKKDVRIIVEPVYQKNAPHGTPPIGYAAKPRSKNSKRTLRHRLSRELRATLYMAHNYFMLEGRHIKSLGRSPGMYHKARQLKKSVDPKVATEYESEVGPQWTHILRHSGSYCGLSIENLAAVLGEPLTRWYDTVYHFQSCDVHALNSLQHLDIHDGTRLKALYVSPDQAVYQSLRAAVGMFFAHMQILHENLDFGADVSTGFDSLTRKYNRLVRPWFSQPPSRSASTPAASKTTWSRSSAPRWPRPGTAT